MVLTPTVSNESSKSEDLYRRDSSSSIDCKHSKSNLCQKPVSSNALTITLAVVVPTVIVCIVLGYFLFRNYRKNKKEELEHDPDFDENGEATALPDLPNHKYEMEDPFHNRNSVRYPQPVMNEKFNRSSTSLAHTVKTDPYLNHVLPFHHQINSKASLDDYARHLGEISGFDQTTSIRSSAFAGGSRMSSLSYATPSHHMTNTSPQKSQLRTELSAVDYAPKSPTKQVGAKKYTNIPNHSTSSFNKERERKQEVSDLESVSDSEDGFEDSNLSASQGANNEKFLVVYENESIPALKTSTHHPEPTVDHVSAVNNVVSNMDRSPFDNAGDETVNTTHTMESKLQIDNEPIEGDFDFSTENTTQDPDNSHLDPDNSASHLDPHHLDSQGKDTARSKSPRISAFNLLKNDSDDEDENADKLNSDQEEELKRMKSVYRVYFDGDKQAEDKGFQPDSSKPLPEIGPSVHNVRDEQVRINKDLKVNTDYDKRMTTTSSIYTEAVPLHSVNVNQQDYNQQDYNQQDYNQQDYNQPNEYYQQQQEQYYYQQQHQQDQNQPVHPDQPLAPLRLLRNASDIRKSTIQTYTDFHPRQKNPANSPTQQRQLYSPVENTSSWSSPLSSPVINSNPSMSLNLQQQPPQQQQSYFPAQNPAQNGTVPSATQLSRSSVVMINPTEITQLRKFKPAGSLPSGSSSSPMNGSTASFNAVQSSYGASENDLIPGNRKSDVRRMMNTNF